MRNISFIKRRRLWLMPALLILALLTIALGSSPLQAATLAAGDLPALAQRQVFNDDLRVRNGETIDGDVTVFRGDVTVDRGGAISGSLVVYDGDIEIKEGGVVSGDITAFSGDIEIDGSVNGSITSLSGDVGLGGEAVVGGDISVVSGKIKQDRGAVVQGSVLRGPAINLNLPVMPALGALPPMPAAPAPQPPSATELFFDLLGRVFRALLLLALAAGIGVALMSLRPAWVEETRSILVERTALSFAAGLIFNLFGLALIGILWITVCFRPPAVLLALIFAAVNFAGLAVAGDEIGRKIEERINTQWRQPWRPVVGIIVPGSVIAFLWILGSCFSFFAYLGALIVTSLGVGAILVKVMKLGEPQVPAAPAGESSSVDITGAAPSAAEAESEMTEPVEPTVVETHGADEVVEEQTTAPEVAARTVEAVETPTAADDFTQISGIGPVFDERLKEAGILTFAQLANLTIAEIAEIVKWSPSRVERSEIVEQARVLAQK